MKLWAKLSETLFRLVAKPYLQTFEENSPEKILRRSLKVLDADSIESIKQFVKSKQTDSGGFADRAGKSDLYYTLFGYFIAEALGMKDAFPTIGKYVEEETEHNKTGVHLHCSAILSSRLGINKYPPEYFRKRIRSTINQQKSNQPAYNAFLSLMTCYYIRDYTGLYLISRQLETTRNDNSLPCPVMAAVLVMKKSFNKPLDDLKKELLSFVQDNGGFKATRTAPIPDLLSTAVALYALKFAGQDLRKIKPGCLNYIDSLFVEGGFGGNSIDTEPDIEYTFYGLLALGSLAD